MTRPPQGWRPLNDAAATWLLHQAEMATPAELQIEIVRLERERRAAASRFEYHYAQALGFRASVLRRELARRGNDTGPRAA